MIYVLFGPPGVGKSYLGSLISLKTDYGFVDADNMFDEIERSLIRKGQYDIRARMLFFEKIIKYLRNIYPIKFSNLVVAQAFTLEENREQFIKSNKNDVHFIQVKCPRDVAKSRVINRFKIKTHIITPEIFDRIWDQFEQPRIECDILLNENVSDSQLESKMTKIFDRFK